MSKHNTAALIHTNEYNPMEERDYELCNTGLQL